MTKDKAMQLADETERIYRSRGERLVKSKRPEDRRHGEMYVNQAKGIREAVAWFKQIEV